MRYTKEVIQKLLDGNEGFSADTSYEGRHGTTYWHYEIANGKMYCSTERKELFEGGVFENRSECDIDTTRRILKNHEYELDTSCVK